jgi:Nucleotidyl transferase of unknown function (DUF2204)
VSAPDDKPLPVSSSVEPNFPPEQRLLFQEVLRLMNDRHIPYVVSGAFALQKHTGIWRDTKDLDLFVPGEHAGAALQALADDGFETAVPDPIWLAKAHRLDYYVDLITGMSNAVIVVDQSWVDRGAPYDIVGVPSRVLAAEELLASKLFVTRRERFDGADTAHVIHGTKGHLDWSRVLHLVGGNWEILLWTLILFRYCYPAHTDYVPRHIWDVLLTRFQNELAHPNPDAPFRGSLIDEKMFAIDVTEWGMHDLLSGLRERRTPKIPRDAVQPKSSEPAA